MDKNIVFKKLICYGLFPEKLSGVFSSKNFGEYILSQKINLTNFGKNRYSSISYKLTRNNNSPRHMGVPHPLGFSSLCEKIMENWEDIEKIFCKSNNYEEISMIRARLDNKNKRLFSMASYDKDPQEEQIQFDKQFGKKYFVHVDISNCYPSIYTHAISWALVGKAEAKKEQFNGNKWFNKLDKAYRNIQDGETKGVPIGPDSSSIASEIILSQIDKELVKYDYVRFIDDYKCYCATREDADSFIRDLSHEIEKYRLRLNAKKTKILQLPRALNDDWVRKLRQYISWKEVNKADKNKIVGFLDLASDLFQKNPNESPIRYAVRVLGNKAYKDYSTYILILRYFLNLCFLFPYVIDICDDLVRIGIKTFPKKEAEIKKMLKKSLEAILSEHIKYYRSDVITWSLFLGIKYNLIFADFDKLTQEILKTEDCIPILMCFLYCKINGRNIIDFIKLLKNVDQNEWWLYIYELSRIENYKLVDVNMEKLRKVNITFLSEDLESTLRLRTQTKKIVIQKTGVSNIHLLKKRKKVT